MNKIGVLFGMEDTFPWAVMNEINTMAKANGDDIEAGPVQIGHLQQEKAFDTGTVKVAGNRQTGQTLTASLSGWTPARALHAVSNAAAPASAQQPHLRARRRAAA